MKIMIHLAWVANSILIFSASYPKYPRNPSHLMPWCNPSRGYELTDSPLIGILTLISIKTTYVKVSNNSALISNNHPAVSFNYALLLCHPFSVFPLPHCQPLPVTLRLPPRCFPPSSVYPSTTLTFFSHMFAFTPFLRDALHPSSPFFNPLPFSVCLQQSKTRNLIPTISLFFIFGHFHPKKESKYRNQSRQFESE